MGLFDTTRNWDRFYLFTSTMQYLFWSYMKVDLLAIFLEKFFHILINALSVNYQLKIISYYSFNKESFHAESTHGIDKAVTVTRQTIVEYYDHIVLPFFDIHQAHIDFYIGLHSFCHFSDKLFVLNHLVLDSCEQQQL